MLGCQVQTVRQRSYPARTPDLPPINTVAVAPFRTAGDAAASKGIVIQGESRRAARDPSEDGVALVARYFAESLSKRGLLVIPADDVARALETEAIEVGEAVPRELARVTSERFGADAVVIGTLRRFAERESRPGGAPQPASVWFDVSLHHAPDGAKLWAAEFNETQQAFTENVFSTSRYPGGGTRWLSAEELAKWGAEETATALPAGHTVGPGYP